MPNRLFVVDTNLAVQKLVEYSLSREGFEVTAFGDGLSALDASDRVKPDIFIVEYNIAGIDLFKFCERIKKDAGLKKCPILVLVNPSDVYDEDKLRSAGIIDFIKKPLESIDLTTKAKRYLGPKKEKEEVEIGEEEMVKMEELLGWSTPVGTTSLFSELKDEKNSALFGVSEAIDEKEEISKDTENLIVIEKKEEKEEAERIPVEREPIADNEPVAEKSILRTEDKSNYIGQIPNDLLEKMIKEAAREAVEKIAWEVIPALAEIAIKKELEKIKGEDD